MARTLNKLSTAKVRSAKPGIYADGFGLYLQCTAGSNGQINKSWFYRFARNGRERRMGLGAVHDVSLAEARKLAGSARHLHQQGIDPIVARDTERRGQPRDAAMTFRLFRSGHSIKSLPSTAAVPTAASL